MSPCPFFPITSKPFQTTKHSRHFKVSCKAIRGDQNPTPMSENGETLPGKFDRRSVLLGLGGLYSAASLSSDMLAVADPVSPDFSNCHSPILPPDPLKPTYCCPPKFPPGEKIIDFKLPQPPTSLRVRQPAHMVDDDYIATYSKAIELMKGLPDDDPRKFIQQANVHCAYCNGAYDQNGHRGQKLEIHHSWLFFPWHRWYLYFFEKILGHLIDDPLFALPFWNWDSPDGMTIPSMYVNPQSSLYDKLRDVKHQPPRVIDLNYNGCDCDIPVKTQVDLNLSTMYRQMVSGTNSPLLFLGSPYRAGDGPNPGMGTLESKPHNNVHDWTGDRMQHNGEDMGSLYSAARDPIFMAHHSNIDRMWTIWEDLGGRRQNFTDPDWLNASFIFYDENKQAVRVNVQDCLDYRQLGYGYMPVDIPWLKARPTPRRRNAGVGLANRVTGTTNVFPVTLDRVVKVLVRRPRKLRNTREKEEEEEVLVIQGIEFDADKFVKFDVYINEEDETESTPKNTEFAGSFTHVRHPSGHSTKMVTQLRLGLNELLEELGAENDDTLLVTLVPRGESITTIGGIGIEFNS
ncbi:unnamed protein product [Ilex paraguariensis]